MENKELKYLKERVYEKLKRKEYSEFLYPHELQIILPFFYKMKIKYHCFYLYDHCEKVILYNEVKPDLVCYKIVCKQCLRHQDILGSLFSHQINTHVFGDIVKIDGNFYLPILPSMKEYFDSFFTTIGKYSITLKEVSIKEISSYQQQFIIKKIIVPTMRIDNILAKIMNTSRSIVWDKISDGEILVNYQIVNRKSYEIKEGDILSIRRDGKYQISHIEGITKKGNKIIVVKKYC